MQIIEKLPNGEILKSSLILIAIFFLNLGGLRLVRSIGINAIENNKNIIIIDTENKSIPDICSEIVSSSTYTEILTHLYNY